MRIYIPSAGRPDKQPTWDVLPDFIKEQTQIVVQAKQAEQYARKFKDHMIVLPEGIETISPTRQWLLDNCDDDKMVMIDDDLTFSCRTTEGSTKLTPQSSADMREMFQDVENSLDDFTHMAISTREGNNHVADDIKEVGRALRFHGLRTDVVRGLGVRFDRIQLRQDFDFTLQMLRAGKPNVIFYNYAHNQPGSDTKGGCSVFRTPELMEKTAHTLAALHPGFVKVVEKETKSSWGGKKRTDVTVYWKKAFADANS